MSTLENEILDIINTTVEGCYTGGLKVIVEDECTRKKVIVDDKCTCKEECIKLYTLLLYMDSSVYPSIQIGKECANDSEFKEYIRDEIKHRRLQSVSYSRLVQELPSIVCDE